MRLRRTSSSGAAAISPMPWNSSGPPLSACRRGSAPGSRSAARINACAPAAPSSRAGPPKLAPRQGPARAKLPPPPPAPPLRAAADPKAWAAEPRAVTAAPSRRRRGRRRGLFRHPPAAAERLIERDQRECRVAVALRELVVSDVERAFGVEHREEAFEALAVEPRCDTHRLAIGVDLGGQLAAADLGPRVGHQRR